MSEIQENTNRLNKPQKANTTPFQNEEIASLYTQLVKQMQRKRAFDQKSANFKEASKVQNRVDRKIHLRAEKECLEAEQ